MDNDTEVSGNNTPEATNRMASPTQKRIILWSVPRSLSSPMCRVMLNSGYSTQILYEPYAEAHHYGPGRPYDHYCVKDPDPSFTFSNALKMLQMPYSDKELVFAKLITFHMAPDHVTAEWIPDGYTHTFIIRHPRRVAVSLAKILDKVIQRRVGYPEMHHFFRLVQKLGHKTVVIDADDVLDNPEGVLRAYCREVGLEFRDSMIHWEPMSQEEVESVFRVTTLGYKWVSHLANASQLQRRPRESVSSDHNDATMDPEKRQDSEKFVQESLKYYEEMRPFCIQI